jgi:Zn-dependent oligopeptidase
MTDVTPEHDAAVEATGKAYAAFNGNPAIINEARELLKHQKELSELTVRQLKQALLNAAEGPMTNPELVGKRVAAETKQASLMNGFEYKFNGLKITANDTPAYYYNYAFATVFKFQLNDYIARKILHQPPQSCNYADNKEVGTWLNNILKKGGTEDWRKVLKEATGEDISTRAMMDYFKPLMS